MKVNVYLNFDGNTEEAFNFYKSVFGGEFNGEINRFKDLPRAEGMPEISQEEKERIVHIELPIGDTVLMGTDVSRVMGQELSVGNNVHISLHPDSMDESERLFKELSEGGMVVMPFRKAFWGDYFGSFTDKFGVQWMINYHEE